MASQRLHLQWHGQQWRVRIKVPTDLVPFFGRSKLIRALHTSSLAEANRLKWPIVAALKAQIEEARRALANNDPITAEALQHRLHTINGTTSPIPLDQRQEALFGPLGDREVSDAELDFLEVATNASTPIDHHLDAFADHQRYVLKSRGDLKRAVKLLAEWLKTQRRSAFVEDVDRKMTGRFIATALVTEGRGTKKAGSYLGFLRTYWQWLIDQHNLVEENPWEGKKVPKAPRAALDAEPDDGKRPYTEDELAKLVYGPAPRYLPDLMRMAALTGMRIEELCQLRARDIDGTTLKVRGRKTDNAKRTVPIHPDLTAIIEARTTGKDATSYLFPELPAPPPSRDTRSDPAVKLFLRYRRKMGVDERPNDKAKSNVEFHSFRRWFAFKAREALALGGVGFTAWTIADVCGHDDGGVLEMLNLTMSHYPGPSPEAAKRACVEAVKLPPRPQQ